MTKEQLEELGLTVHAELADKEGAPYDKKDFHLFVWSIEERRT